MQNTAIFCTLNSKYIHASLAPFYLAAAVNQSCNGFFTAKVFESTVKEAQKSTDKLADAILTDKPLFIGFSCYIWNIETIFQLAKVIKEKSPKITIALGGPEAGHNAKQILNDNTFIDYVFAGEGEKSVPEFLNLLAIGTSPKKDEISGLNSRSYSSLPCFLNGETALINPYTDEYFKVLNNRIAYIETSRGCPFSCAFCLSGSSDKPRYYEDDIIFENIIKLANSGTQTVKFIDRTFNSNARHANKILQFLLDNIGKEISEEICFHFEIAADILKDDTMKLLEKMPHGTVQLEIGMQSFNEKTLQEINRKTDTKKLIQNINRLVESKNMHIHIDLIAGLPHEGMNEFKNSFNIGYALKAHVMQMGFLKMLHGSEMRDNLVKYPCDFDEKPPYQVKNTPWLSEKELEELNLCEDALERIYNSGRFLRTAQYAILQSKRTPFDFYCEIGKAAKEKNLKTHNVDLDVYTEFLYNFLVDTYNIDKLTLRDYMVKDRLSTNASGKLPKCLQIKDELLAKASNKLKEISPPLKGVKRGVALLYSEKKLCFTDYINRDNVTKEYIVNEILVDNLFKFI